MSPFIAIAGAVLPEILKTVLNKKHHESVETVSTAIEEAVKTTTGSDDPADASQVIEQDPKVAAELRIRLAEIAAEQEQAERDAEREADEKKRAEEREAETEKRAHEIRQLEASHAQAMDRLKADLEAAEAARQQDFTEFKERLADVRDAREGFEKLAQSGSKFAWAPPVISTIIVLGFFTILAVLLVGDVSALGNDTPESERLFQIINIVIGALTAAFATVVSFWLGSSQGSKQKDLNSFVETTQRAAVEERRLERVQDRDERVIEKVAKVTAQQAAPQQTEVEAIVEAVKQADKSAPRRKPANENNFKRCIGAILEAEGGFVDHPEDPGGATNRGITFNTLKAWRHPDKITVQDVKDLTEAEAQEIYRANYWNALKCDDLPEGVDLVVFDFGVNAGPSRSAKTLQRLIGVNDDGQIGPITLAAVDAIDPAHLVRRFGDKRMDFYRGLKTFGTFGKGWTRRVEKVQKLALAMTD